MALAHNKQYSNWENVHAQAILSHVTVLYGIICTGTGLHLFGQLQHALA